MSVIYRVKTINDDAAPDGARYQVNDPQGNPVAICDVQGNAQTVAFALNALRLNKHPDSLRLDHLIAWDHSRVSTVSEAGTGDDIHIEKVEFIFERTEGGNLLEVVRAAIDRSITSPLKEKSEADPAEGYMQ